MIVPLRLQKTVKHRTVQVMLGCVIFMTVACSPQTTSPTPIGETQIDNTSIALFTEVENLEDGFYALTYNGLRGLTSRLGFDLTTVNVTPQEFNMAEFDRLVADGLDVAVMNVFAHRELMTELASQNPDVHFVGIDYFQEDVLENATGVVFAEGDAGYLAGVLAANLTQTDIVGGVYGVDIPPVVAFADGYEQGAKSVNEGIEVLFEFHPDEENGFADPEWGADIAASQLDAGADVIFTAAGGTGIGALTTTAERASETDNLYCIGVDTDQWLSVTDARPCLVSSAIKNIPAALDELIPLILGGNPPAGNYFGPVGLAPFHDFSDQFSDLRVELDQIQSDIQSGTLEIR